MTKRSQLHLSFGISTSIAYEVAIRDDFDKKGDSVKEVSLNIKMRISEKGDLSKKIGDNNKGRSYLHMPGIVLSLSPTPQFLILLQFIFYLMSMGVFSLFMYVYHVFALQRPEEEIATPLLRSRTPNILYCSWYHDGFITIFFYSSTVGYLRGRRD